jgi:hypothetical protein
MFFYVLKLFEKKLINMKANELDYDKKDNLKKKFFMLYFYGNFKNY